MKAQMIGGPDDGRQVDVEPGQRSIEIHIRGKRYSVPIRRGRIFWNERTAL